ncbi:hypothetical protein KOM00_16770, partial [Geomonas sp. Red69]|uniref:hypothetical protein n=1 Tax=Geomonas diazotrophica TaxID=2843197 RepID=UPI001C117CA3
YCGPSSCRVVYSVAKNVVTAKLNFIAKAVSAVNAFLLAAAELKCFVRQRRVVITNAFACVNGFVVCFY